MSRALDSPRAASDATPDQADAARWMDRAARGDFEGAWAISDRVMARRGGRRDDHLPRHLQDTWNGEPLDGRRVLIRCYHGLGDTLQFIRYAPWVKRVASEVIVWAQPALLPLLATSAGIDRLLALHDGAPGVDFDVDVEIMELPFVFRTTLATIPAAVPYVHAEPAAPRDAGLPRVGIVWRAGEWNPERSIAFDRFRTLIDPSRARWVALQHDVRTDERHASLHALAPGSLLDTARRMRALDLVITVDSMPAHLAGALAVPVWTLLPHDADWRWMRDRSDTPWYPTMRLFRQPRPGDWDSVLAQVGEALAGL